MTGRARLRVVVVDDVELARRRNVVELERDETLDVVADAADLRAVLPAVAHGPVDVAVVALGRGGVASPGTLAVARRALPGAHLVILVGPHDDREVCRVDGGEGAVVVGRSEAGERLLPAVREAAGASPADRVPAALSA